MEWLFKNFLKSFNIPNISIFSFPLSLNIGKNEHLSLKYEHYDKFISLDEEFKKLDKCSPLDINNIILEIHAKSERLKDKAGILFGGKISELENEIFENIEQIKWECDEVERIKDKIFNQIVRTKFQHCKKEIEKELKNKKGF